MERVLIVNADDFGLSKGQNYGIIEACRNGVVTSTTALVNGAAIDHAAQLSRSTPELAVGMHFCTDAGRAAVGHAGINPRWPAGQMDLAAGGRRYPAAGRDRPRAGVSVPSFCRTLRPRADAYRQPSPCAYVRPDLSHRRGLCPREGIALRIDRQGGGAEWARPAGGAQRAGFSSEFYGEAVSEELFLQTLDASIARGERSWR